MKRMKKELKVKFKELTNEEKKNLKGIISRLKIKDDELESLFTPEESDPLDDDSEDVAESEEQQHAEEAPAQQEVPKGSSVDIQKMIAEAVQAAFKAERDAQLMPAQKPLAAAVKVKKAEPAPKPKTQLDVVTDSNGQLIW
jgi:hypothetical protein